MTGPGVAASALLLAAITAGGHDAQQLSPRSSMSTAASRLIRSTISSATLPFIFDDNHIFVTLDFVRADGSVRPALTYVDDGTPQPTVSSGLAEELGLRGDRPLLVQFGALRLRAPANAVAIDSEGMGRNGPNGRRTTPVEAILSGSILKDYVVTIDYRSRTLTLDPPRPVRDAGIPIPCFVNPRTGLITVRGEIGARMYDMAIDVGSAYTWFRRDTVQQWTVANPGWLRGVGAVGESNMQTSPPEVSALIVRIPEMRIGELRLRSVGALGITPDPPPFPPFPGAATVTGDMFDWYSAKAPRPVLGWIGANVLRDFRLTIDYPQRIIWWARQRDPDAHDLDQVGLTLEATQDGFAVSGIAQHDGQPAATGFQIGDRLVRIDSIDVADATRGAVFGALHGTPGEIKTIVVDRDGSRLTLSAPVVSF
jgi:hypothetical protein